MRGKLRILSIRKALMAKFRQLLLPMLAGSVVIVAAASADAGPFRCFRQRWAQPRYQSPAYNSSGYGYYDNSGTGYGGSVTTGYRGVGVMGANTYDPATGRYDTSDHNGFYGYGL